MVKRAADGDEGAVAVRDRRRRPPGPRGMARRRALLDAAARLFVAKGYDRTTVADLVQAAGGSRASIYALFGDKEGLFRAMMEETNRRVFEHVAAGRDAGAASPDEALVRFGMQLLTGILDDDARAVVRVLVTESGRFPEIAEAFWRGGPEATVRQVADYLRMLSDGGRLRVDDPDAAAQIFIAMMVGEFFIQGLILPGRPIPAAELERRVRHAVKMFLDGVRAAAPAAAAVTGRS